MLAHGVGVLAGGEGAYLDVEELVLRLLPDGYVVAALLEGSDEDVGVFAVGDGGDLDDEKCCRRCPEGAAGGPGFGGGWRGLAGVAWLGL